MAYASIQDYRDNFKPQDPQMAPEQEMFAKYPGPYSVLSAGAGSGKTYTIEKKVDFLVNEAGLDLKNILALSFTRTAASNLSERYKGIKSMTFDAFSQDIFDTSFPAGAKLVIADDMSVYQAIKKTSRYDGFKNLPSKEVKEIIKAIDHATPSSRFNRVDISQAIGSLTAMADRYRDTFQQMLIRIGLVSFNIRKAFTIASSATKLPGNYDEVSYLIIDEAQDSTQPEMVMALSLAAANDWRVAIVGDASQNISEWRGVKPEAFMEVQNLGGFERFSLQSNYRSEFPILHVANQLLKVADTNEKAKIKLRQPVATLPLVDEIKQRVHLYRAVGEAIGFEKNPSSDTFVKHYSTSDLPIDDILDKINQAKTKKESFVILARSNNLVQCLASALNARGAGLFTKEANQRPSTYRTEVVSDLISRAGSTSQLVSHFSNQTSIELALKRVMKKVYPGYLRQLKADIYQVMHSPSIIDLIKSNQFERLVLSIQYMMTRIEAADNAKRQRLDMSDDANQLAGQPYAVATFHASKGLEWDHVLIIDETFAKSSNRQINRQEELRLAYVAITRARKTLDILQLVNSSSKDIHLYADTKTSTLSNPFGQAYALAVKNSYDAKGNQADLSTILPDAAFVDSTK